MNGLLNLFVFAVGIVFGSGVFYSLTLNELKNQKEMNKMFQEKLNELSRKIDCLQEIFIRLTERIAKLESKLENRFNGKNY